MRSLIALLFLPLSHCVTLSYERPHIISKSQVELSPILITCGLSDIIILAAPVIAAESVYHLHKPNNDVIKLKLPRPTDPNQIHTDNYQDIVVKYKRPCVKTMYSVNNGRVISTRFRGSSDDVVTKAESSMNRNEFMIGPLLEEDYGNWVLSVYFKDLDDNWTEFFQVITIEIVERVPLLVPKEPSLKPGATLSLSFPYPIKNLQSCELVAPSSTFDRFFDRSKIDLDSCGYVIPNVTKADEGAWKVIGLGNIVYEGNFDLKVL